MCFSAQASFIAASLLLTTGIISITQASTIPLRLLASSTLLFSIQQALEGVVWLTFSYSTIPWIVQHLASLGFVIFALVVWPIYIPAVLYSLEKNRTRQKIIAIFLGAGILSAMCSSIGISMYGVQPSMTHHNISYSILNAQSVESSYIFFLLNFLLYLLAVIGSLMVSTTSYMCIGGIIVALGLGVSLFSFWHAFGSVWCYFGAITSLLVYASIIKEKKLSKTAP